MDSNLQEFLLIKAAFQQMTASEGWRRYLKFSESTIRDLEREALIEDDPTRREQLIHDARGARKYFEGVIRRIEIAKATDSEPTNDDFLEVVCD